MKKKKKKKEYRSLPLQLVKNATLMEVSHASYHLKLSNSWPEKKQEFWQQKL